MTPFVSIILLNYRGVEDTLSCIKSLEQLNYPRFQVIVVDNDSQDNSVARLQAALPQFTFSNREDLPERPAITLIPSPHNGGFSAGNNLGIRFALDASVTPPSDYIWLLNNDTTVEPDSLSHLVTLAQKTHGLTGSRLLYPDGQYQQVGTRISWLTGSTKGIPEAQVQDEMSIHYLSGASLLIPRQVIERIGLLDESYFLYFEDGEYSLRAHRAGYSSSVATRSIVYHEEGASTGRKSLKTQYYYHRNRLKCLLTYAPLFFKITITLYTVLRLVRSCIKGLFSSGKRLQTTVQWLAYQDFIKGVTGPCPHPL